MAQHELKLIDPAALMAMDVFCAQAPIRIDLVYAQKEHPDNVFKTAIYRREARLWLFAPLAMVVMTAANICFREYGYIYVLHDGFRSVEAQAAMQETLVVKQNPQWCEGPNRLLSRPGTGGHPRAMAIDITLETENGEKLDMGTPFDGFEADENGLPLAHRKTTSFGDDTMKNRAILEKTMVQAAHMLDVPLLPLPQEWWDFRLPPEFSGRYAPLHDRDLPPDMRMV